MSQSHDEPNPRPIRIVVSPGLPGDQALNLRVSPEAADEIRALMREHGVYTSDILEHASGPELVVIAGSIASGLGGVAAVLRVYFGRHRGRSIKFSEGDQAFEINGYPPAESDALVDRFLVQARERALMQDKEWRRVLGDPDPED